MKCAAAPFFRRNVGDSLSEVPAMPIKILSVILALAIGMFFGFSEDDRSVLARALAMTFGIFDADLDDMRIVGRYITLSNGEAPIAGFHLDPVVGDTQPHREAKGLRQPVGSNARIWVDEHRNHCARGNGPIESHKSIVTIQ